MITWCRPNDGKYIIREYKASNSSPVLGNKTISQKI